MLLNDHAVLRPAAVLRFIYLDPNAVGRGRSHGDNNSFRQPAGPGDHGVPKDGADSAWGKTGGDEDAGIFDDKGRDDVKQRKSRGAKRGFGPGPLLFAEALDHASEEGTTIVYASLRKTGRRPPRSIFRKECSWRKSTAMSGCSG